MAELPRIFFDANLGTPEIGYWLIFDQSKKDLSVLGANICEGMHVIIYSPDELEMEAILKRREDGLWLGVPIKGTIKYLDGSQ